MQRRTRRSPLVATALTLALALGTLVGLTPGGANALIPYPDTERISVSDAISAGIAISKRLYKADEAGAVILTRDDKFPDGLAASALSGDKDAPVLFTPSNRLASATRTELDRVLAAGGDVYLMGGEVALEPAVEQELKGAGYRTIRIGGDDRVNTAANAAQFFVGAGPGRTAILVRARGDAGKDETQGWPDAIACGGYAANTQTPVVLTNPRADSLPQATVDALNGMDIDRVIICGGPNAVPADHAGQLVQMGITVSRYAGDTRVTTAIDVARRLWNKGVSTDGDHFILVNGWGTNFAYGIAAAPLSGDRAAPVLIVNTDDPDTWPVDCSNLPTNSAATLCYLNGDGDDRVGSLTLIGATSVVTDAVFEAAARAGGIPKDTKPPTVPAGVAAADTPEDDGKHLDVTWEASTDASGGAITYTVYVREASDDELTTANSTKAGTVTGKTALTIGGLTAGTDYETAVTASDRFGNTSKLSPKSNVATPTDEIPAAPASAPNVQNQPGPKIVVSWIEAPEKDAAAYIVERANPSSFTDCDASPIMVGGPSFEVIGESKPKTNTSFTDDTVETGEAYCYRYRIKDTTGNQTAPSDPVAVEATDASEDNTPPPGTPQLYAVNFDQTEGLIGGGSAASRTEKPQTRLDVIVPSGAFSNGETGHVIVFVGGSERHDETFAATGSEQIVSAPVSLNNDENDSTLEFTVRLADAAGNRGNVSAGWSTEFDRLLPAVPRIVAVDGVNTDPLNFANARIPVVGDDTPRVDPTPLITVGGLSTSSAFAQRVTLWHNGLVAAQSRCFASGSVPSNGQVRFNDPSDPESPEVTMLTGTNTLVVTLEQRTASNCGGTVVGRAGDSNTVRYVFNASSFGILTSTPLHGADDVFAFQDLDEFTVTLNKPAAAGATLALRRAGTTTNVASTTAGSASDTLTLAKPASFGPGGWELVVNATASDDSSQKIQNAVVEFFAGFVNHVHASGGITAGDQPALNEGNDPLTPADESDPEVTFVIAATAPTGQYRIFEAGGAQVGGAINHTAGSQTTRGDQLDDEDYEALTESGAGLEWTYTQCTPNATDDSNCSTPGATFPTTDKQSDGAIPDALTAAQVGAIGLRQAAGTSFRFDGVPNLGSSYEVYYRPTRSEDGDTIFASPAQLIRTSANAQGAVDHAAVSGGWTVRYYVRNVLNGNVSMLTSDGVFRTPSIQPANGLGNAEGQLESGDSLTLTFGSAVFDPALDEGGTADAGLQIFEGPAASQKRIVPNFGASSGASDAARGLVNAAQITITFGSATTHGGKAVPQPVATSPPRTIVHGGATIRGLNWAVDGSMSAVQHRSTDIGTAATGHVALLRPSSSPSGNTEQSF